MQRHFGMAIAVRALPAAVRNPSAEMGWPLKINYDNFDEAI